MIIDTGACRKAAFHPDRRHGTAHDCQSWPAAPASLPPRLPCHSVSGTARAGWPIATVSRHLPAVTASLGLLPTPVIGVVIAARCLGEALSLSLVSAIVLILGGVVIGAAAHGAPPMPAAGWYSGTPRPQNAEMALSSSA